VTSKTDQNESENDVTTLKTIGMLGGMSWESTADYYHIVNEVVKERLGGLHSARVLLHSVDFFEIEKCQSAGDWDTAGKILGGAAHGLEQAGADFIVICTNTMHKVADQIQSQIGVPILHIADATAEALNSLGLHKVALLGTRYTMTQDFLKGKLVDAGFDVMVPDDAGIELINRVIFDELCLGQIRDDSRQAILEIVGELSTAGAEGVILGCTELPMLIKQPDCPVPILDTTTIHATAAAMRALAETSGGSTQLSTV